MLKFSNLFGKWWYAASAPTTTIEKVIILSNQCLLMREQDGRRKRKRKSNVCGNEMLLLKLERATAWQRSESASAADSFSSSASFAVDSPKRRQNASSPHPVMLCTVFSSGLLL